MRDLFKKLHYYIFVKQLEWDSQNKDAREGIKKTSRTIDSLNKKAVSKPIIQ